MIAWYACRTEPGREIRARESLLAMGLNDVYLALSDELVTLPKSKVRIRGAMIPGYIFFEAELSQWLASKIAEARGIVSLLPTSNEPQPVPFKDIAAMRDICDRLVEDAPRTGDLTWMVDQTFGFVESHPWFGKEGICKEINKRGHPVIELTVFGETMGVPVPVRYLDINRVWAAATPSQDFVDQNKKMREKRATTSRVKRCSPSGASRSECGSHSKAKPRKRGPK